MRYSSLDILRLQAIERNTQRFHTVIKTGVVLLQVDPGALHIVQIKRCGIAYVAQNRLIDLCRNMWKTSNKIAVHLPTHLLQLWISREESIYILNEPRIALPELTSLREETYILLHGQVSLQSQRIRCRHNQSDRRSRAYHLPFVDQEIKPVHLVEIEGFLILIEEHLYRLTQQFMLL